MMRTKGIFAAILLSMCAAILFSGCGGGGGSSSSTPTTTTSTSTSTTTTSNTGTISGTVSLPSNTNAKIFEVKQPFLAKLFISPAHAAAITDLTKLTVAASGVSTNPDSNGVYSLSIPAASNINVQVIAPSGNVVLEAIVPAVTAGAVTTQTVDTTSTAVALIYKQNTSLTISQISSSSAVTNVKTAIETALTDSTTDSIASNSTITTAATTAATTVASGTTAPSAPTGVSATAGNGQVTISWSDVTGATSYNLYMASQSGVTKSNYSSKTGGMAHTGVTSPYTLTGLTNGTTYYFVATAVNSAGESSESSEVSAAPAAPNNNPTISSGPTVAPSNIVTSGTATVSVTASDADGDTLSYSWAASSGTISGTGSSVTYAAPSTAGTYTISVTVSDGKGGTASGSVNVAVTVGAKTVSKISAGGSHTCAVLSDGSVKCWGDNYNYYGTGHADSLTPTEISGLSGVTQISSGGNHTCALIPSGVVSGGVKCWGDNSEGELGNGTKTSSLTPGFVYNLMGVAQISAGSYRHTCVLTSSGGVKCWGGNSLGQLGNGTTTDSSTPVDVLGLTSGVSAISAGWFHTCALTSSGTVKCWGDGKYGKLGNAPTTGGSSTPVNVLYLSEVTAISSGADHTCALTSSGGVKCWGWNAYGQLGNNSTTNRTTPVDVSNLSGVTAISLGSTHTCALTSSGNVQCWGSNNQLGNGLHIEFPVYSTVPVNVSGLSGVVTISAGGMHTCALTSSGEVKCWGENPHGQLGNGTTDSAFTPVSTDSGLYASSPFSIIDNYLISLKPIFGKGKGDRL